MERNQETRRLAQKRRKRRARQRLLKALLLLLVLAAAILLAIWLMGRLSAPTPTSIAGPESEASAPSSQTTPIVSHASPNTEPPTPPETTAPATTEAPPEDESWKLLLVNADHPLPEGYSVILKELRYGHQVDERIYPELQQMFDDARAVGIHPLINESFRTGERQQEIMDKYIASYEAQGMSHEEAVAKARTIVALPGTSEHQLGLAVDIIAEFDPDSTATWQWLKENSWRYGFILRYPAGKEDITGIGYEPWHFRYVGVPAAQEITEQGLCLEEYVEGIGS